MTDRALRIPPQSITTERTVLGSIMISETALDTAMERLTVSSFYATAHKAIFSAIISLVSLNTSVDIITVSDQLKKTEEIEDVGGELYLSELIEYTGHTANIDSHCQILEDKRILRDAIVAGSQICDIAFEPDADAKTVSEQAESAVYAIGDSRSTSRWYDQQELLRGMFENMERVSKQGVAPGLLTGFTRLDEQTTGLHRGDLVIVAGRPSMGKTAFALSIAMRVAKKYPQACVAFFSLEMSKAQIIQREISAAARVEMLRIRNAKLNKSEQDRLGLQASEISQMGIYVDDEPCQSDVMIRSKLRRLSKKKRLSLAIIDYLQLMRSAERHHSREQEVSAISRSLKATAKQFDIPVIALAQLSRECEKRPNKRPIMSDLRESGGLEQDADLVLFPFREYHYTKDESQRGVAEIIIGKQRNGPTGMVMVSFEDTFTRFDNLEHDEQEDRMTNISQEW